MLTEAQRIIKGEDAIAYNEYLRNNGMLLYEAITGSQAYGTNLPTSDIDKVFVYYDPLDKLLNQTYTLQTEIDKDYKGYEIGRYLDLLKKQSPNLQEILWQDEDTVLYQHPLFKTLVKDKREFLLSRQIADSFGSYAAGQIKKARGMNKMIMDPMDKERRGLLDFCYVTHKQGSKPLKEYLKYAGVKPEMCGAVAIEHMKNCYHLFIDREYVLQHYTNAPGPHKKLYKGIVDKDDVQIVLSSVEKGLSPEVMFYCNFEGWQTYIKLYNKYWEWVENRNEVRYQDNLANGAQYDSKNMMHCYRLLDTCCEALRDGKITVRRPNRELLLQIRAGVFPFDELLSFADKKLEEVNELVKISPLPEEVPVELLDSILFEFRKEIYKI
jgi:hypothetical protein